jgi:hypothetical protein
MQPAHRPRVPAGTNPLGHANYLRVWEQRLVLERRRRSRSPNRTGDYGFCTVKPSTCTSS